MRLDAERVQLYSRSLTALLAIVGCLAGTTTLKAQTAKEPMDDKIGTLAADLAAGTQLKTLTPEQQRDAAYFVIGNMLFAVVHEFGHAVINEMQVPVIGRMEDGADSFAIVTGLKLMTDTSERALIEAGKGWFFLELAERKSGELVAFYDSHGMNMQRAYEIVCYMVGANYDKFKALADATKLPESRQKSCKDDFAMASWSWEVVLWKYFTEPGKPSARITVNYDEATGPFAVYAKTFKELRFLDRLADLAMEKFTWRRPITMSMETCGKVNAWWSEPNSKITVCYELIEDFVKLYMQFMTDPAMAKRMDALVPPTLGR
jgi:hypothetical protein